MGGSRIAKRSLLLDVILIALSVLALICAFSFARAEVSHPSAVSAPFQNSHFDSPGYPGAGLCSLAPDGSPVCDGNPDGGGEVCLVLDSGKVLCYDPAQAVRGRR